MIMEEGDMYESLPTTTTVTTHMMAGAAAGVMEHCIMYPVDCVKTRMQSLVPDPRADYRSVPDALYRIVRHEGLKQTIRGINAVVCGAGPAHAMYFACYEKIKRTLSGGQQGHHLANGTAGCVATLLHDAFMNPADVIKQRMQMYGSPYRTCYECATTVYREEGFRAFYRSFTTQLSMNVPFQCIHFMMYEVTQDFFNQSRQYNPKTHVVSGAMAGAVAAFVTMPLDVCKTLLNTQEQCARSQVAYITGIKAAFRTVYEFQGVSGFFRGVSARILYQMPATAISWSVYEFFKYFLTSKHKLSTDDGYLSATSVKSIPIHHASSR